MEFIRLLIGKPNAMHLDALPPLTLAELAQTENDSDYKADTGTYKTDAARNSAFAARLWMSPEPETERL